MPEPSLAVGTVPLLMLLAFSEVSDAPEPLKVVAVAVPLTFRAPLSVEVPMATWLDQVDEAPVNTPVNVGEADNTTLPDPVEVVVQLMPKLLVAVQKLLASKVPKLTADVAPMITHVVPLQYCMTCVTVL